MSIVRITKEFQFEMAHALSNYDGKCKNIHGHTYRLFVTIIGKPIDDPQNPKNGMLMDFGDLKRIVIQNIFDKHDHYLVLNGNSYHKLINLDSFDIKNVIYKNYQPTCENLIIEFANILKANLPENVNLFSLKLYETSNSYAEWYSVDNNNF